MSSPTQIEESQKPSLNTTHPGYTYSQESLATNTPVTDLSFINDIDFIGTTFQNTLLITSELYKLLQLLTLLQINNNLK